MLNENYHINMLMNNKDVYIRFDKFRSGEINKLLICASLSGSGKSTLALKYAKQYNAHYIECDKIRGNVFYSDEEFKRMQPFLYEYFDKVWTHGSRFNIQNMEPELRRKEIKKCLLWLLERPEPMVIEGGEVDKILFENEYIRNTYPLIFKGTSMLNSMKRMSLRELKRDHPGRTAVDNIIWWMKWCARYKNMTDQSNILRDKIMQNNPEYEEIEESFLPELKITLYHGSIKQLDKIKPMSFSNGNRLRDPEWAVFMFREPKFSMLYALAQLLVEPEYDKLFNIDGEDCHPVGWFSRDTFLRIKLNNIVRKDIFERMLDYFSTHHPKVYVYQLEVPLTSDLNIIGTTNTFPEYTYAKSPKLVKRYDIIIDSELIQQVYTVVSNKEYHRIKKSKPHTTNLYGPFGYLLWDMEKRGKNRKIVLQKLYNGEIKPGDDLSFLNDDYQINLEFLDNQYI